MTPIVGTHRMTSAESHLLGVDFSANLEVGETLSAPVAQLVNQATGSVIALPGLPTAVTPVVRQQVGPLTVGRYHLLLTATGSSGNTWGGLIVIECIQ